MFFYLHMDCFISTDNEILQKVIKTSTPQTQTCIKPDFYNNLGWAYEINL